jgi:hypothetical protein
MRSLTIMVVLFAVLLGAAGCGQRQPVPVRGVVTLDGRALADVAVLFVPEDESGRPANGYTNAGGEFALRTFTSGDGAFPGPYKVIIQVPGEMEVPADLNTPEDVQKAMGTRVKIRKGKVTLPDVYTAPDRTVLRQTVPADGLVKLELRSEGN